MIHTLTHRAPLEFLPTADPDAKARLQHALLLVQGLQVGADSILDIHYPESPMEAIERVREMLSQSLREVERAICVPLRGEE